MTYRVSRCEGCPLMEACGGKDRQRQVAVRIFEGEKAVEQARIRAENETRCRTDKGKALLRTRGPTIERNFARVKRDYRMRRFSLEGFAGAHIQYGMTCLLTNLTMLMEAAITSLRAIFAA